MRQEFFKNLPSEITSDILSRLPVKTIISCKCVCKSWLDLVESCEFAECHLSKSVSGLLVFHSVLFHSRMESNLCRIYEYEDGLDLEHHDLHYIPVTNFNLPFPGLVLGSANGLLFLRDPSSRHSSFYICNPITREYINLHSHQEFYKLFNYAYGFGASKMTGQHKAVRIIQHYTIVKKTYQTPEAPKCECHVYTLGTGSWRSIELGAPFEYHFNYNDGAAIVDGKLHWLVDFKRYSLVSYFDLETETFSTFSAPPLHSSGMEAQLFTLHDCLYLCDVDDSHIVIWYMKEYGVEKSWTKELVICQNPDFPLQTYTVNPIKVFNDGDILMASDYFFLFYYSGKRKTTQKVAMFTLHAPYNTVEAVLHTLCFISLRSFRMENVISF